MVSKGEVQFLVKSISNVEKKIADLDYEIELEPDQYKISQRNKYIAKLYRLRYKLDKANC